MPKTVWIGVVAVQQQEYYTQVINKIFAKELHNLWAACGPSVGDPSTSHMMDFSRLIYQDINKTKGYCNYR